MSIQAINRDMADAFVDEYEDAFQMTRNGTLKCDKASLIRMATFCNNPTKRFLCELVVAVPLDVVIFEDPGYQGDIGTTNRNKALALKLYGVWSVFYQRLCQTANRQMSADLLPPLLLA